jgi:hypothetical protein
LLSPIRSGLQVVDGVLANVVQVSKRADTRPERAAMAEIHARDIQSLATFRKALRDGNEQLAVAIRVVREGWNGAPEASQDLDDGLGATLAELETVAARYLDHAAQIEAKLAERIDGLKEQRERSGR